MSSLTHIGEVFSAPDGCKDYTSGDPSHSAHNVLALIGLIKMHAELVQISHTFRATGRLSLQQLQEVSKDLERLGRRHELDQIAELILARADELDLLEQAKGTP